ncbi:hypothetical protein GMO_24430 [Gluconobacter morbifer G707]|uniref:Uncharacterized protein n=1 Tax=Gluconobacter morbifer G707 TaxID=1088869 RepID=G6XL20_9PROT|nr:hypothetical protein GMO_24430 [Gluconobacter morbifer G707]
MKGNYHAISDVHIAIGIDNIFQHPFQEESLDVSWDGPYDRNGSGISFTADIIVIVLI